MNLTRTGLATNEEKMPHNSDVMWYLKEAGEETGPFTPDDVNKFIKTGWIGSGTYMRRADWDHWKSAIEYIDKANFERHRNNNDVEKMLPLGDRPTFLGIEVGFEKAHEQIAIVWDYCAKAWNSRDLPVADPGLGSKGWEAYRSQRATRRFGTLALILMIPLAIVVFSLILNPLDSSNDSRDNDPSSSDSQSFSELETNYQRSRDRDRQDAYDTFRKNGFSRSDAKDAANMVEIMRDRDRQIRNGTYRAP